MSLHQLDNMLINSISNRIGIKMESDSDGKWIHFLVTEIQDNIYYIDNEWSIKTCDIPNLLDKVKEHIVDYHNNKIFVGIESFIKLDENNKPTIEVFCKYKFKRDDIYLDSKTIKPKTSDKLAIKKNQKEKK